MPWRPMRAQGERRFLPRRHLRTRRRGMGASTVWCRFPGWSRAHVRPAGGTRARRSRREDRGAGRLDEGADWALPARARLWPSLMCAPARERVQGPGRGDRGTDRGAASPAPRRWSGRPCGRNLRECSGLADGGATARAPAGPCLAPDLRRQAASGVQVPSSETVSHQ
jgi:hypothetical protein